MILIGLGSNLITKKYSTSKLILEAAISSLVDNGVVVNKVSRFYETEPVPISDQSWFVNAVISVDTNIGAPELLNLLHKIEHDLGRVRHKKWEARIIDLDLLCYDDVVLPSIEGWGIAAVDLSIKTPVVPHGRLHERNFVLMPISDIDINWKHPVLHKTVNEMLDKQDSIGIVKVL